jgi:hypothetical protein
LREELAAIFVKPMGGISETAPTGYRNVITKRKPGGKFLERHAVPSNADGGLP